MKTLVACVLLSISGLTTNAWARQRLPVDSPRLSVDAQRATKHYRAGWELMRAEAWAEAAGQFQQAIDIDSKFALAYYALGRAHMAQKKYVSAIDAYLRCQGVYLARAGEQFANQAEANKYRDDVLMQYREALRQVTPTGPQAQAQTTSQYQQHLRESIRRLEEEKNRNSGFTMDTRVPFFVSMSLGAAYFRTERFVEAERAYRAALDDNPNSGETHNNLGVLYMTLNRLDEATREITLAEKTGFKVNEGLKDELKKMTGR